MSSGGGFPEKQLEIRDRHGLEVHFEPVGVTAVEYETGDLTLSFSTSSGELTLGYGSGAGVMEALVCESCDRALTSDAPLRLFAGRTLCRECAVSNRTEV